MRTAGHIEHRHLERKLRPRFNSGASPVRGLAKRLSLSIKPGYRRTTIILWSNHSRLTMVALLKPDSEGYRFRKNETFALCEDSNNAEPKTHNQISNRL
ncbi:hypothetical protein DPMN_186399 [Dreissena polymorpha]|uniref:Uncharacterized protein n=1 Tax=Dreissena polymorpha TaxID=45954 RepID=A0A9D4I9B5_DREPO|nr:hypothetical protein DPMN_186399 [Dreissena polymorpha]